MPARRWRIAWLLGIGVLVNYFDRVNLSVSHASLTAEFGISDIVFGYLLSAYSLTYAACQLPIGVILDRLGVRRVGRIGAFLWSVASFGAAVAPNMAGLFGARFVLGVGEAPTFPANAKAIGYWFPIKERSLATSIFDAAAKFASAIGVPIIGILLLHIGWRWSFALTGLVSFAYFIYFWKVYRDPADDPGLSAEERRYIEEGSALVTPEEDLRPATPLMRLLARPKVLGLAIGFGAYNYVFYMLLMWLPTYLATALHIDLYHSFLYTGVPWLIATVADVAVGGWLVDALVERGWNADRVRKTILIGGTACGLGILGAAHAASPAGALAWISLSIGGLAASAPVVWSLPSLIAHRNDVGKVGGIVNFSSQVSGILAPIVTGYLVAAFHSYTWAFGVAGIYLGVGIAAYVLMLGRLQPEDEAAAV
ncbi:MAG: MFS transporter [Terracidiphilus sp.]|nr:MFS transporter [Terracidiphilus sp.]